MGTSTDAILVYGIPLAEGEIDEYEDTDDNEDESSPSWMVFMGEAVDGISVVTHCSNDCPMHIVAIARTEMRAWRGAPRMVGLGSLTVSPLWNDKLLAFVEKHRLGTDGLPGWYLCSMWS